VSGDLDFSIKTFKETKTMSVLAQFQVQPAQEEDKSGEVCVLLS
jgi:hypothetical protein